MQANRNGGRAQRPHDHAQDIRDQAVVLTFVLTLHPRHLTIPQLARSLNEDRRCFQRPDAVERAVRELVGVGLIQIDGGVVKPTAAAVRFLGLIESGV
ncbi:MAG TPA: hypothetical protein VFT19_06140 [Solirubrobacterales bacterium]|nr:hypothetical protein [Solirubrobacterales bacterium]